MEKEMIITGFKPKAYSTCQKMHLLPNLTSGWKPNIAGNKMRIFTPGIYYTLPPLKLLSPVFSIQWQSLLGHFRQAFIAYLCKSSDFYAVIITNLTYFATVLLV